MLGTAIFKAGPDLNSIVTYAVAAKKPVLLVHDQGLYLMVSGLKSPTKPDMALCVYAEGCDPLVDADHWWDNARAICGGDDFGEEIEAQSLAVMIRGGNGLRVRFSESHLDITSTARKAA
jgi:hypothetical protein